MMFDTVVSEINFKFRSVTFASNFIKKNVNA